MALNYNEILTISEFQDGFYPFRDFPIFVDKLTIGRTVLENVYVNAYYDRHMQLNLSYKERTHQFGRFFGADSAFLSDKKFGEDIQLIVSNKFYKESNADIALFPTLQPMLINFGFSAIELDAVVINGPEIIFSDLILEFEYEEYIICMSEFPKTKELRNRQKKLDREYLATGKIVIKHRDGKSIEPDVAWKIISHFCRFLTFIRGAHCGIGNIVGHGADGDKAFAYLGFSPIDQFKISTGWCDMGIIKSIPKIYDLYCAAMNIDDDREPLVNTLEFYRASNVTRETSLEMAIVASHAALETIVPHLLGSKAGWSANLLKNRDVSFNDKLRAAAKFIGLAVEPLENLPALQARSKGLSNVDAYELISLYRNRIVHQSKKFDYRGVELFEIWNLSQWLCEVFLLFWLDYRGEMNDRRNYMCWRGEAIKLVPFV